ncbi:hypothetical protein [Streptomyces sp. ISL-94]|nr:hypothetical protein [Streptomyces sp. ISL-94]MBT2480071.1 hypothetical protein [Streptomyces sp. ISL-94]
MTVEQGGQVPTAVESVHLLRVDLSAEADQQTGPDEVADRRSGHARAALW